MQPNIQSMVGLWPGTAPGQRRGAGHAQSLFTTDGLTIQDGGHE